MKILIVLAGAAALLFTSSSVIAFQERGIDIEVDEILPIAAVSQVEDDRLLMETGINLIDHGLEIDDLRSVGSDDIAAYWVGIPDDSRICLVGYIPGKEWVGASTCSSVSNFYSQGIGLGIGRDTNDGKEVYLLPADISPSQLDLPADVSQLGTAQEEGAALISVDFDGIELAAVEVERENGVAFRFTPLVDSGQ